MKKVFLIATVIVFANILVKAQTEPSAGNWKTWFITSGKEYRLPAPLPAEKEIDKIISLQNNIDSATRTHIMYWNAGAPGYRWQQLMNSLWPTDTGRYGALANMLLGTATYDAMISAWETKYAYKRPRPYVADKRIKVYTIKPESPSFPCEQSVAAGVAVTIFTHFYPHLADSVKKLAEQAMSSRIAAGVVYPSDTKAGFDLGKKIAAIEIERTKDYVSTAQWDGKIPDKPGLWSGKYAMLPTAGHNKTVVLQNGSEFRPAAPPDFAKDMAELKNYKQNFRSLSNAFYWANQSWFMDYLPRKMFEDNLQMNPPCAARINAVVNVATYDCFVACWDAKYAYWGIRPNQYDTTFKPAIFFTPPFPGYPSGHAAISGLLAEVYSYFFPGDKELFLKKATEAAESRFQAGIHFRTDNEVALELGKKVGEKIIAKVKRDGAVNF
jgi:hypothetical protein